LKRANQINPHAPELECESAVMQLKVGTSQLGDECSRETYNCTISKQLVDKRGLLVVELCSAGACTAKMEDRVVESLLEVCL
jgi:hypothetical protein